jgi:alpha-glucosidase (family GH31 glycosyl hydrolase)
MTKIQNPLPSAPPIFLRSGKLILTNVPATRVARLNNHYTLIAALQDNKAKGSFLAINNFTDNNLINACVAKGCSMAIEVTWGSQQDIAV